MGQTRVLPIGALALAGLTIAVPISAAGRPTTYAAVSTGSSIADLVAGFCLLAAGALVTSSGRHGSVGPLTILLGGAWLAHDWVGWDHGWPAVRTAAGITAPLIPALLVHLAVGFPSGRVVTRVGRVVVGGAYLTGAILTLSRAFVGDPSLDRYCWANCSDNLLLVHADIRLARDLARAGLVTATVTSAAAVCWSGWRTWHATPVARRTWSGVLAAVAGAALVDAAYRILLLTHPAEDPSQTSFVVVFLLRAALLVCVAVTLVRFLGRSSRAITLVERLRDRLGDAPFPGTLRDELASSLGDHDVQVAYWLPVPGRWSNASGHPVDAEPPPGRAVMRIVRDGSPVALVTHDAAIHSIGDLGERIGAAARLAVDNERLRAQLLAQLDELRASRARIVAAGDDTRRRLERDLHDDIQHRLLAVAYELRRARQESEDPDLSAILAAADAETSGALAEVREVAHGIFPAILTDAGLAAALRTLAERAPTELTIGRIPSGRFPAQVECAAYAVVSGAVDAAGRRNVTGVAVTVTTDGDDLVLVLTDDGPVDRPRVSGVEDRVAALGGRIEHGSSRTEVRVPCGW